MGINFPTMRRRITGAHDDSGTRENAGEIFLHALQPGVNECVRLSAPYYIQKYKLRGGGNAYYIFLW